MPRFALLAVLPAALTLATPVPSGTAELFRFQDSRIDESSGIVVSSYSDDVFFTHNDSGDRRGRFFAVDRGGRTLADIRPDVPTKDVEDIGRRDRILWLADIGDNSQDRDEVQLLRIREPRLTGPVGKIDVSSTVYRLRYPDGRHNAESLLVQPGTARIYVATKNLLGGSAVYAAPSHLDPDAVNRLTKVASVPLLPTGGAFSPQGDRLVLRGYRDALMWRVERDDLAAALRGRPRRVALPRQRQGEGVTFTRDGRELVVSSEGANTAVYAVPLPSPANSDERVAPAGAPPARPWLVGTVALVVAGGALSALAVRRAHARR